MWLIFLPSSVCDKPFLRTIFGCIWVLEVEKEFKEKRKKHYNEYSKVKLARKLIEQELKDLEDDNDTTDGKIEEPSSSEAASADTQVIQKYSVTTFSY